MFTSFQCVHCGRPLTADGRHITPDGKPGFLYVQVCQDCGAEFWWGDAWRCPNCGSRHVRDDHVGLPVLVENLPLRPQTSG